MALGLLMPLTPLAGTRLVGHITVGSTSFGGGRFAYGFASGLFGSVSGPASADMEAFYWVPGIEGVLVFYTAAFGGGYFSFGGVSILLEVSINSRAYADFTSAQVSGWPTSGTHPFYVELP